MALFFKMAFSGIEEKETFDAINVAVVSNEYFENDGILKDVFRTLSDPENEDQVFNTSYVEEGEAKELLQDGKIDGYVVFSENAPKVFVTKNGVNQTIFKFVVEEIVQSSDTADIIQAKVEKMFKEQNSGGFWNTLGMIFAMMQENRSNIKDISDANLSYMTIEFYTLVAMACLYGGILGAVSISWCLANMTNVGKRLSLTPVSKIKLVLSSALAGYVIQLFGIVLLLILTIGVLKVDFGNKIPQIVILSVAGSMAGLTMGIAVTTGIKASENAKTGILIGVTMLWCFFAGMMGVVMKYVIDKNIPIINKINPANMITDGFYALYYYDTLDRYMTNIVGLCIFSAIMLAIAIFSLRKQKYESL
ncbi:MAG: ABC transporter permease [Clostridia bacterium]|nr:ABC transporter permease [Clostridia bacterium]